MQAIDWILIFLPLVIVLSIGIVTQRYMKSVADFLSGGRLAGRYLLAVARGEMQAGAVVFVASFEVISKSGFTLNWWGWINIPAGLLVALSGFVIYRYRETRAMTLAQFFEIRYNKSFRLFTGSLGFVAGLANFGIIPAVGARFLVYFLGFPPNITLFSWTLPTYIPHMGAFLCVNVMLALSGGFITLMMTDCIEGMISQVLYLVIIASLVWKFNWGQITDVLGRTPAGQSLMNPFDSMGLKDFNLAYILMGMFGMVYGTMAWQNQSAYNAASLTAHESRMGGILGRWRESGKAAVVTLLAVCAMTFLAHPDFAAQSAQAHGEIGQIADHQVQQQMRVPIALSHFLPPGVKGALCAVLLLGIFGGDANHLHSWGGLFVQDVLVPLRKRPFAPKQHIRLLRLSILGVALFAFLFGSLFRQTEYIVMWWTVTSAVYVGGAGAAIIGGLYWKKGTAPAAWAAMVTGALLSVGGIVARQVYLDRFPFNGMEIAFYSNLIAIGLYVIVSLLTCKEDFDMDRMLHRGQYAQKVDFADPAPSSADRLGWLSRVIGIDENFTGGDKWIAGSLFGWSMLWFVVFVVGTVWNLVAPWPTAIWSGFWHVVGVGLPIFIAVVTAVWFTWGGIHDITALFKRLAVQKINHLDDGTVINHQNLVEEPLRVVSEPALDSEAETITNNHCNQLSKTDETSPPVISTPK